MKHTYVWADLIRVVAICLVVLVHSFLISPVSSFTNLASSILFILARTCVPLFIMLSGALLIPKHDSLPVFFVKRGRRIILPWLTWTIIIFLTTQLATVSSVGQALVAIKNILIGQFTFIPVLGCLYALIPPLQVQIRHGKTQLAWYLTILWFAAASLLPYLRNSLAFPVAVDNGLLSQTARYSGYLVLGWLLTQVPMRKKFVYSSLIILCGAVWWTRQLAFYNAELRLEYLSYFAPLVVISTVCQFYFLRYLGEVIANNKSQLVLVHKVVKQLPLVLSTFSKASFSVFLCHVLVLNSIVSDFISPTDSSVTGNLSRWVVALGISFGGVVVLQRIRWIRKLI